MNTPLAHRADSLSKYDEDMLRHALALARRVEGRTGTRPAVGCVISAVSVGGGVVLAAAHTSVDGTYHAEQTAVERWLQGGAPTSGGEVTAYVTLEPCSSRSRHGVQSCAQRLAAAGVRRVVYGLPDANPNIDGHRLLASREVTCISLSDICASAAATPSQRELLHQLSEFYRRYMCWVERGRSYVTVKLAASLDGRIALASGVSKWISAPASRRRVQLLRSRADVVVIGAGTARQDAPRLDCRLGGADERSPAALILDGRCRLDPLQGGRHLVARARMGHHIEVLCGGAAAREDVRRLRAHGIVVTQLSAGSEQGIYRQRAGEARNEARKSANIDVSGVLALCADRKWQHVLVEGGGEVFASFLRAGLVDELVLFSAGVGIGSDGVPSLGELSPPSLEQAARFKLVSCEQIGGDVCTVWRSG